MRDISSAIRGFTLIELMITLSIAAILLTVAVPNFIVFVQNNRLTGQANDVVTLLNLARSEAVKRGQRIAVCSRDTDTACAGTTNWDGGLLVFVDANANGIADAGEEILRVRQGMENGNTLRAGAAASIAYQSSGSRVIPAADEVFRLCDTRGPASARAIAVSPVGRASMSTGTALCP